MAAALKRFLNDLAGTELGRLGYSDARIRAAKREGWWWLEARSRALRRRRGLRSGVAVVWTEPGRAECIPVDVPRPGRGEVMVAVTASVISSGTERAQYLRLPNARIGYPHRPGYSAAGVVLDVGAGVSGLARGDEVAVVGASHASLVTVPARSVFRVAPGASVRDAAFVQLGVICRQGIRRAEITPGDEVCIVGSGLVGLLSQRLALAAGSGLTTVVARSRSKEPWALTGDGHRFLALDDEDDEAIASVRAPVVIEATGDPDALSVALAAAAPGAKLVLLGSPRGVTRRLPLDELRAKGIVLVGAHVETLAHEQGDARREEAERFLGLLADGRLYVDDLAGAAVDPREADGFYRRLAHDRSLLAARFDWTAIPEAERVGSARVATMPAIRAEGVEIGRPRKTTRTDLSDPFADAVGMLRIGFAGCGDIAVHNARAVDTAPNARLVACYDPIRSLAAELAHVHGAEVCTTFEELLDRADVDAVFIAVPHHLHAPLAIQAAEAGKHVIVEKPLAHTLEAALELADAVERAGVTLSVCFPHRYEPSTQHARALVARGALGDLSGTLVNFFSEKPASYWLGGFSGRATSTWRASRELAGGGVLIMNLSHVLDVVRFITGLEVEQCAAVARATDGPADVEDTIALTLGYANGAVGSLMASSDLRGHRGGKTELHIWGSDGYVVVQPDLRVYTARAGAGLRTTQWHAIADGAPADVRAVYVTRLAAALTRGEPPDVTAADALAVQALIEAAYRSSDLGEVVRPAQLLVDVQV